MKIGYACLSTPEDLLEARTQLKIVHCDLIFTELHQHRHTFAAELDSILTLLTANDMLVIITFHHLSRSFTHLLTTFHYLAIHRIGIQSITESLLLTGDEMHSICSALAALVEFQAKLIRERTQAGLTRAKTRGTTSGRPRALTPEQTTEIASLYHSGQVTVPELASRFHVSKSTIRSYLRRYEDEIS